MPNEMMMDPNSRRLSTTKYLKSPFLISLKTLSGQEPQAFGNFVWENLLFTQIPTVFSKRDVIDLDLCAAEIAKSFSENNTKTTNFTILTLFLLSKLKKMRYATVLIKITILLIKVEGLRCRLAPRNP
jgi:hypothetical protein